MRSVFTNRKARHNPLGYTMQIDIFQLTEEENLGLIHSALSTTWPEVHFTYATGEDSVEIHWTDGPWEHDVLKVAETYTGAEPPTWEDTIIIGEPDGEVGLFYPSITHVATARTVSASIQEAIITALSQTNAAHNFTQNGHKLAALAELDQYSAPIPPGSLNADSARIDPIDQQVVALCHLLRSWCDNPHSFSEDSYETIACALYDQECRAVLASALSDESPVFGAISNLLDNLLERLYEERAYTSAGLAQAIVDNVFPQDDDLQPGLFESTDPRMDSFVSLGKMLRTTVADDVF